MWILECEGDCLQGRRIWLRPGCTYLFGRTKPNNVREFRVDHRSVSRKHLTLTVSPVKAGDVARVSTKTGLSLKDEDTKFKSIVDGETIQNTTKQITASTHTFSLGKSEPSFRLRWIPCVLTFSFAAKEKKSQNPLATFQEQIENFDIKALEPYLASATTHVVASKRNTAKGLQALINGQYIVTEEFIAKLLLATAHEGPDQEESLSPLEKDFDANWPNALEFLPAQSREPNARPPLDFRPDARRVNVFEGYTFVFCDEQQFSTLQAPITNGAGKAVLCKLTFGVSTVEDIVRFVKSVAGEKGLGEFEDGSEGKGVTVVKFRGKGEYVDWAAKLNHDVAQTLDHRLIEQNEFLEAILANDASILRRPLLPEDNFDRGFRADDKQTNTMTSTTIEHDQKPAPAYPRDRAPIISRFKGFADDDDDTIEFSSLPKAAPEAQKDMTSNVPTSALHVNGASPKADRSSMQGPENGTSMSVNRPPKRGAESTSAHDEEAFVDQLLPGAAAMKRRRIEEDERGFRSGTADMLQNMGTQGDSSVKERKTKPIDVKQIVREKKKAEDLLAQEEQQNLREVLGNMTFEEVRGLVQFEDICVRNPGSKPDRTAQPGTERWDERWNGRKNFKKFRRRGTADHGVQRIHHVIVPLEEAPIFNYGNGQHQTSGHNAAESPRTIAKLPAERMTQTRLTSLKYARDQDMAPSVTNGNDSSQAAGHQDDRASRNRAPRNENAMGSEKLQLLTGSEIAGARALLQRLGPKKRKVFAAARNSDESSSDEA